MIRGGWESSTSNWLSFYRRDDQYSREKISGDLEKLSNFYLDRGYVDFNVESTQIAISPSLQDMYITANVTEGEKYKISDGQGHRRHRARPGAGREDGPGPRGPVLLPRPGRADHQRASPRC